MSPRPEITPAPRLPVLPRQTDTYDYSSFDYSSFYAEFSSLYPDIYSSYSYDSAYYESLLSEYSALASAYSYSVPDYNSLFSATATRSGARNGQASSTSLTSSNPHTGSGLSTGAKIGIGVAVPLVVGALVGVGIFLWCLGKNKGKKTSTTIIAPPQPYQPHTQLPPQQQQNRNQPQMGYVNPQGYMQGYQQQGGVQMPSVTPPPHYVQPQGQPGPYAGAYSGYAKGPEPGVAEMEQEYHFARPGVVEMGDGVAEVEQDGKKKKKKKGGK